MNLRRGVKRSFVVLIIAMQLAFPFLVGAQMNIIEFFIVWIVGAAAIAVAGYLLWNAANWVVRGFQN